MCTIALVTLLTFIAQTHADMDTLADRLVNQMADRALEASYLHNADLDTATLGKPGNLAMPSTSYQGAGNVGALEEALEGVPDNVVVEIDTPDYTELVLGLRGGAKKAPMKAPMAAMKAMKTPMAAMKAPMKGAMKAPSTGSVLGLKGGAKKAPMKTPMAAMKAMKAPMAAMKAPMKTAMKASSTDAAPTTGSVLGLKGGAKKAAMKAAPMAAMKAMKAPMAMKAMKAPMKAPMKE